MSGVIRVVIVDDHPIVRAGLVGLVDSADDIEVVGTAATGLEAIAVAAELAPDVVLMDLRMPDLDGDEATAQIVAARPQTRVVILTTYETDDAILRAIEAGARGYLLKAAPEAELLAGIRAVAAGDVALAPRIAALLVKRVASPPAEVPTLSARELEVLRLVAQGLSNRAIGERLFLGGRRIIKKLLHAFTKLDVSDRTRAVTRAMELKLL